MFRGGIEPEASWFRLEEGNQGTKTNSFYKKFFFNTFTKTAKTTVHVWWRGGVPPSIVDEGRLPGGRWTHP